MGDQLKLSSDKAMDHFPAEKALPMTTGKIGTMSLKIRRMNGDR
jgi:hypothetical protein